LTPSGLENAILTAWWEIEIEKRVIFTPGKIGRCQERVFYFKKFFQKINEMSEEVDEKMAF